MPSITQNSAVTDKTYEKTLLVACLCAEWCDTCRDYRTEFDALGRELAMHRFVWIDIEDQADLVSHIEVENFPTLLLAHGDNVLFAGTMLPQIGRLRRLLLAMGEQTEPQMGHLSETELSTYRALTQQLNQNPL